MQLEALKGILARIFQSTIIYHIARFYITWHGEQDQLALAVCATGNPIEQRTHLQL